MRPHPDTELGVDLLFTYHEVTMGISTISANPDCKEPKTRNQDVKPDCKNNGDLDAK